eukprot:GCRY01005195.1.p1 GENE.GCRY01005195.1~~GCRY01005195.1.p1  ORF type:complete len:433 (-),score=103.31 GCRY01005195.1:158-1456(-)
MEEVIKRLENIAGSLENSAGVIQSQQSSPSAAKSVGSKEGGLRITLHSLIVQSLPLNSTVLQMCHLFAEALQEIELLTSNCRKCQEPSSLKPVLEPVIQFIQKMDETRNLAKNTEFLDHCNCLFEAAQFLLFVSTPSPPALLNGSLDTIDVYAMRILRHEKNMITQKWVKTMKDLCGALRDWFAEVAPKGLKWGEEGSADYTSLEPIAQRAQERALISQVFDASASKLHAALAAAQPQPKPVAKIPTPTPTTHTAPAPQPAKKEEPKPTETAKKAPKTERVGKKWHVCGYTEGTVTVDQTNSKQSVCVYNCSDTIVLVKGTVRNITVDQCVGVGILFDTAMVSTEVINSSRVSVQVKETCPTFQLDRCESCRVFLSPSALHAEVFHAKCSSVNIMLPKEAEGEFDEVALEETLRAVWDEQTHAMVSTPVALG